MRFINRNVNRLREPPLILKACSNGFGYLCVNAPKTRHVHRLVLEAFVGPPPAPGMHGAHLNGKQDDNRIENLAWVTQSENEAHKAAHGTKRGPGRKFTREQVLSIRADPRSGRDLAEAYGVSSSCIFALRSGETYPEIGFPRAPWPQLQGEVGGERQGI
jgi:hypothetical protein